MNLEIALVSFPKINDAAKAYAAARERSGAEASWPKEVGFVEHHESGKVVLRGNFAGHYVDVDEGLHVSQVGAAEGFVIGAILGVSPRWSAWVRCRTGRGHNYRVPVRKGREGPRAGGARRPAPRRGSARGFGDRADRSGFRG